VNPVTPSRHVSARVTGGGVIIVGVHLPTSPPRNPQRHSDGKEHPFHEARYSNGVRRGRHSRWVGWSGAADSGSGKHLHSETHVTSDSSDLIDVNLTSSEVAAFYQRFSNEWLRSALHCVNPGLPVSGDWEMYQRVNERYAEAILREVRAGDLIWVHDYHLMLVPRLVRNRHPSARIGFFLHAPFPSVESFMQLPLAATLADGVLGADWIEMETCESAANFLAAVTWAGAYRVRTTVIDDAGRRVCVFTRYGNRKHRQPSQWHEGPHRHDARDVVELKSSVLYAS
jgi:trehalose-6-phosphate synthase